MTAHDDTGVSDPSGSGTPSRPPPGAPLRVLHDDRWLVAVDKPAGLLVHRTALDAQADDDLLTRLQDQLAARLWPVHRLDKGTSGVLLLARDADTARRLGVAFMAGADAAAAGPSRAAAPESPAAPAASDAPAAPRKRYLALVRGWPGAAGCIDTPLARDPELPSTGQPLLPAVTHWQLLQQLVLPVTTHPRHPDTRLALLAVQPHTGRRHQIRRHLKSVAHPLVGDATHGKGPLNRALAAHLGVARLWLHAEELRLDHPVTGAPLALHAAPGAEWRLLDRYDQPNATA